MNNRTVLFAGSVKRFNYKIRIVSAEMQQQEKSEQANGSMSACDKNEETPNKKPPTSAVSQSN